MQIVTDTVEQPFATAEQDRRQIDFHLIYESSSEILLRRLRSARQ